MQRRNSNSSSAAGAGRAKPSPAARPPVAAAPKLRLPDPSLIAPGDELYFAYGSNMSPAVLTGRRRVHPKASQPGIISGYTLSFRLKGVPYIEPGFGTIERSGPGDRDNVHGVVHLITKEEWAYIKSSEGVGMDTTRGYQVVHLPCQLYNDNRTVTVVTLQGAQASLFSPGGRPVSRGRADMGVSSAVKPSQRYLQIIQEGAQHHGLSQEYRDWLQRIQAFDSANMGSRLGQMAMLSTMGFGLSLAAVSTVTGRVWGGSSSGARAAAAPGGNPGAGPGDATGSSSSSARQEFVSTAIRVVSPLVWFAHDRVLAPFLGKGM